MELSNKISHGPSIKKKVKLAGKTNLKVSRKPLTSSPTSVNFCFVWLVFPMEKKKLNERQNCRIEIQELNQPEIGEWLVYPKTENF
mgnify:CR=1 FL=1